MEVKKYILIYIIFASTLYCTQGFNYKIKYFGFPVADCKIAYSDTIFNTETSKIIDFQVNTGSIVGFFYPISNNYRIILNNENQILYFKKKTFQPNLLNQLETESKDQKVFYKGTNYEIKKNYYNIFSLLYAIIDKQDVPDDFILEREGALYNSSINKIKDNIYELNITEADTISKGLIKNTDIFTWAVFMKNAKRRIIINKGTKGIKKCIFSKGIITVTAEIVE